MASDEPFYGQQHTYPSSYHTDPNASDHDLRVVKEFPSNRLPNSNTGKGWGAWSTKTKKLVVLGAVLAVVAIGVGVAIPVVKNATSTQDGAAQQNDASGSSATSSSKGVKSSATATSSSSASAAPAATSLPLLPSTKADARASLAVSTSPNGGTIPTDFVGLSYEKGRMLSGLLSADNTLFVQLLKTLGAGNFRIGGNTVDTRKWNATGAGGVSPWLSPPDIDRFAGFINATGWDALYGIRYMPNQTAADSAAEASYATQTLGGNLLGFEIGNEPDLYPGSHPTPAVSMPNYTVQTFMTGTGDAVGWNEHAEAIRAAAPDAVLTGPSDIAASINTFAVPFASAQKAARQLAMLSHHYYVGLANDALRADPASGLAGLMDDDPWLDSQAPLMISAAEDLDFGARFTEAGTHAGGGVPGLSDTYVSTLWSLKWMFQLAEYGFKGVNMHGGSASASYTPILDDGNTTTLGVRPLYYGLLAFSQINKGKLLKSSFSSSNAEAYGWMIRDTDNSIRGILLNTNNVTNMEYEISWPSTMTATAGTAMLLQAPEQYAKENVTLAGAEVGADGTWTPQTRYQIEVSGGNSTISVPALTGVLVEFLPPS